MTTNEIRSKFLDFMKSKGHAIIPSAPVYLQDDPTVLFTTAGMQPLVPFLLGAPHPEGSKLANAQKCIRTNDIEEVGDPSHLTFFEMLGSWSLGDYFKDQSIPWSWEFLTDKRWLGLDPKRLYVTVYAGDHQVSKDTESIKIWQETFAQANIEAKEGERILTLGKQDNWWEIGGAEVSPAGPDTEMFYYLGDEENPKFDPEDSLFFETWNNVFMAYQRQADGSYVELKGKNVDTGMGLERTAAMLQGVDNVYDTDLMRGIQAAITDYAGHEPKTEDEVRAVRIITDHMRSATFMAADGVKPTNTDRGYVMRRLIRRAVRQGLVLGIRENLAEHVYPTIIKLYHQAYPELDANQRIIHDLLTNEEAQFRKTLERGLREFTKLHREKLLDPRDGGKKLSYKDTDLSGIEIFTLFDTFGFPPELSIEEARRLKIPVPDDWQHDFDRLMAEQRERSRTATAGEFKGGLADHSDDTKRHHTATHLMYQALRQVLGDHVVQRGSNVNGERLRFDFSHDAKLTDEQKAEVERIVNEQIQKDLKVWYKEHPTDEAFKLGAKGAFGDKYGDVVKVYFMGREGEKPFSIEICGGPHVQHTGELGHFKILKEESSSAGVRRIKATVQ
jgi:alanyl-tRNA synthetase